MHFRVTQQFTLDCTQMLETTAEKRRLFVFESHVIRVHVWDLPLRPRQTNCVRARTMVWQQSKSNARLVYFYHMLSFHALFLRYHHYSAQGLFPFVFTQS